MIPLPTPAPAATSLPNPSGNLPTASLVATTREEYGTDSNFSFPYQGNTSTRMPFRTNHADYMPEARDPPRQDQFDPPRYQEPWVQPRRMPQGRGGGGRGPGGRGAYMPHRGAGYYEEDHAPAYDQRPHGIKLEVQSFGNNCDPEVYLDWEQKTEQIFQYYNYSEAQRVAIASIKFEGYAYHWWLGDKAEREYHGHTQITTWQGLKQALRDRFVPDD